MTLEWRRIYDYPFNHQAHVFVQRHERVGFVPVCPHAKRHAHKMTLTKTPAVLDTCPACARWLRGVQSQA